MDGGVVRLGVLLDGVAALGLDRDLALVLLLSYGATWSTTSPVPADCAGKLVSIYKPWSRGEQTFVSLLGLLARHCWRSLLEGKSRLGGMNSARNQAIKQMTSSLT